MLSNSLVHIAIIWCYECLSQLDIFKLKVLGGNKVMENKERRPAYCKELCHSKQLYRKPDYFCLLPTQQLFYVGCHTE